ncbi:MAG: type II secretion system F family protein [Candidatus Omnitrophota bacterium]
MPQFSYKAKSAPGQVKTGAITADNETVVIKKLRQDGLFPVSIDEIRGLPVRITRQKINSLDIAEFTRQLANLIHSGFSLARALNTLKEQIQHPGLKKLIQNLSEKIEKGAAFSKALSEYPESFSSFYLSMIKIGESTGNLDEMLLRLADFKEKENELIFQVKAALTYPIFLFIVGFLTLFALLAFFVPRLVGIYSDFGQALPAITQVTIAVSVFMNRFWWLFIIMFVAAFFIFRNYYKNEKNRLAIDSLIFQVPFLKTIIQQLEVSRFSYSLAMLLKSGIPVLESLEIVVLSVDNRLFRRKIGSFKEKIGRGQSLSSCFRQEKIFPSVLCNMAAVGEESGELTEMLFRIAANFEAQVNRTVKSIVTLIEPILIIFIGGIVVLLVFAILLPIFQLDFFSK